VGWTRRRGAGAGVGVGGGGGLRVRVWGLKGVCNRILFHFDAEAPENVYNYGRPRVSRRL